MRRTHPGIGVALLGAALLAAPASALAQSLGFDGGGNGSQPIRITAQDGISWNQKGFTVTAKGNAKAVRGKVTVTADELVAHYRPKKDSGAKSAAQGAAGGFGGLASGASTITRLDAVGHVHIFTATEQAFADLAIYHMDEHELVLTGKHLKLTTPTETVTARQSIEYWSAARKAVARGDAKVTGKDGRSISADTLTGYFAAPGSVSGAGSSGPAAPETQASKLRKVTADGNVLVRTATDVATGDHGVYHPATGIAVLTGNVHITHGPNELTGAKAEVDMKTGVATLMAAPGHRVEGLVIPGSAQGGGAPAQRTPAQKSPAHKSPQSGSKPGQ